jgi:hypothetical protein
MRKQAFELPCAANAAARCPRRCASPGQHGTYRTCCRASAFAPPRACPACRAGGWTATTPADLRCVMPWLWLRCERCQHRSPAAIVPLIIRWGAETSSDVLLRFARCTRCGRKGATIHIRGWGGLQAPVGGWPAGCEAAPVPAIAYAALGFSIAAIGFAIVAAVRFSGSPCAPRWDARHD